MATSYNVFVRDWWKYSRAQCRPRTLVPHPTARKTYLAHNVSEAEALRLCREYNSTHDPGLFSRKAEYERV